MCWKNKCIISPLIIVGIKIYLFILIGKRTLNMEPMQKKNTSCIKVEFLDFN